MSCKNIWIINETIGSRIHGMVFRPYYLAKEFVKKGESVTIFSGSYTHIYSNPPVVKGFSKTEVIDGINYCWIKTPKYKKSQSIGRIINAFAFVLGLFLVNKKSFGRPDVIIVTSPTPFSIINGYYYKKKFNAKLIFEVRDIWPLTLIEIGNISKWHPFVLFMQIFENFSYKVSDNVVSVLPEAYRHMEHHGMKRDKFVYIPNGIDMDEIDDKKELPADVKMKLSEKKFTVMYAGKIGQSNAMEYLISAAERLKDIKEIRFVIVGDGVEKAKLMELVQVKGLGNVIFTGPVKKDEVCVLLRTADVLYIGWHKNNLYKFGISANKLFDYMHAGKPVIHSVQKDTNDCISVSGAGISVDAESPEDIADAIKRLYSMDKDQRDNMGKLGRKFVTDFHSYEKLASDYMKIINDV